MRGFTLLELMTTLAIFGVITALTVAALGPLKDRYNHEQAVEMATGAAVRAQLLARESARCHVLEVYAGTNLVANDIPGDRLRIQRRRTADCDSAVPDPTRVEHVEWLMMPEGVTVTQVGPGKAEWRPNGRLQSVDADINTARDAWLAVTTQRRSRTTDILFRRQGSICIMGASVGNCPCRVGTLWVNCP